MSFELFSYNLLFFTIYININNACNECLKIKLLHFFLLFHPTYMCICPQSELPRSGTIHSGSKCDWLLVIQFSFTKKSKMDYKCIDLLPFNFMFISQIFSKMSLNNILTVLAVNAMCRVSVVLKSVPIKVMVKILRCKLHKGFISRVWNR